MESSSGDRETTFYKAGKAGTYAAGGQEDVASYVEQKPFALPDVAWVAVLLDRGTASSGEAIAISFAGRPRERSFGEHTAGFSTSNDMYTLSDGASLFLCVGIELDRTGHRYPDGIDPDVKLPAPGFAANRRQGQRCASGRRLDRCAEVARPDRRWFRSRPSWASVAGMFRRDECSFSRNSPS